MPVETSDEQARLDALTPAERAKLKAIWDRRVAKDERFAAIRDGAELPREARQSARPRTIRANPPDPIAVGEKGRINRPGTELKAMLALIGLTGLVPESGGCLPCDDWVRKMDEWGPEGCKEHRAEIVTRLEEQRAKLPTLDFIRAVGRAFACGMLFRIDPLDQCGSLVDEAIRRSVAAANARTILIEFPHGLGDTVQLVPVLRHLAKHRPEWTIDVLVRPGRGSVLRGHCRGWYVQGEHRPTHDRTIFVPFPECDDETKPAHCLRKQFGIEPEPDLMRYIVNVSDEDRAAAEAFYLSLGLTVRSDGRWPVVIAHYKGASSPERKSLPDSAMLPLADECGRRGLKMVVLDWSNETDAAIRNHPAVAMATHANMPAEGGRIAALIESAAAWVGIDSGPGHVGGGTSTPGVIVWTHHHPLRFYDPCPNVLHLVPIWLDSLTPGADHRAELERLHRTAVYYDLASELPRVVLANLAPSVSEESGPPPIPGAVFRWGFWVTGDRPVQAWTIISDVYTRDAYRTRLRPKVEGVEYVVDVGANIGAFARLWQERNPAAQIACVEVHTALIEYIRANVPGVRIVPAACHYGTETLYLLDAIPDEVDVSKSIGGSRVVRFDEQQSETQAEYAKPPQPVPTVTLEQVCEQFGFPRIDVLKLDCEGSEFSILEHCDLSRIGTIFVESHDPKRWRLLLESRLASQYHVGHMSANGNCETWHLVRKDLFAG